MPDTCGKSSRLLTGSHAGDAVFQSRAQDGGGNLYLHDVIVVGQDWEYVPSGDSPGSISVSARMVPPFISATSAPVAWR